MYLILSIINIFYTPKGRFFYWTPQYGKKISRFSITRFLERENEKLSIGGDFF